MKKTVLSTALVLGTLLTASFASAQDIRAITEDGRRVVLSADGKWRFDAKARPGVAVEGGSPYQTSVKKIALNFNTNDWMLAPKREGEASNKRMFQHRNLPIYALVIADELPASNESLKAAIFSNAATGGFTTTTLIDQTKALSGHQVGELRFAAANKSGLEFVFSSYYYADEDGNVQLMCYTAQSLFHKYQAECEKLLNGLAIK